MIELLTAIVADGPVADVLAAGVRSHLDTMATVIANRRAVELGRPVSESEVGALLAGSAEWRATTAFVRDLGIGWRGYGCR